MGQALEHRHGGIFGLVKFLREHGEAVEYHLITLGLRLEWVGTERLSWRDLWVIIQQSPPGSSIHAALDPEAARWARGEPVPYLLAHIGDTLANANWQRSGRSTAPKPKPLPRPGMKNDSTTFGAEPIPIADFDDWWGGDE